MANLFIAAYLLLGTSNWPDIWTSERACIRIDTLMWLMMGVAVNAIPLFRQVRLCGAKMERVVGDTWMSRDGS